MHSAQQTFGEKIPSPLDKLRGSTQAQRCRFDAFVAGTKAKGTPLPPASVAFPNVSLSCWFAAASDGHTPNPGCRLPKHLLPTAPEPQPELNATQRSIGRNGILLAGVKCDVGAFQIP